MTQATKDEAETAVEEPLVTVEMAEKALFDNLTGDNLARLVEQKKEGVVNPIVLAKAINVRPQMIYNYIRDGRIPSELNDTQKIVIPFDDAVAFAAKYFDRKARAELKRQLELQGATDEG